MSKARKSEPQRLDSIELKLDFELDFGKKNSHLEPNNYLSFILKGVTKPQVLKLANLRHSKNISLRDLQSIVLNAKYNAAII